MPSDDEIEREDDPDFIKDLRRKAKERDQFESELTATRREVAVLSAGLGDLSERQRKALLATHDGELTPEGLRASAAELGFVKAPEPDVPDAEREAMQRVQQASAAAEPAGQPPDVRALLNSAQSAEELQRIVEQYDLTSNPGHRPPTI